MTLLDVLRRERQIFTLSSEGHTKNATQLYRVWTQGGRTNEEMVARFFEEYYRGRELAERVDWLTKIINDYTEGLS